MNTSAPFLPPVARPPHDPRTLVLCSRLGWRTLADPALTHDVQVDPATHGLSLAPLPGSGRLLGEANGSFGGLVWPDHMAGLPDGGVVLLDRDHHRLLRLDACCCAFVPWPCLAEADVRLPTSVVSVAFACGQLLLADPTGHRLIVVNAASGGLRGAWRAPLPKNGMDWAPTDSAATPDGAIVVTDPANGALHVFDQGCYCGYVGGLGAVRSVAVDCFGLAYVRRDGEDAVLIVDLDAKQVVGTALRPAEIGARFVCLPVVVRGDGLVDITALCACPSAEPVLVDATGAIVASAPADMASMYPTSGQWVSEALDSEIAGCIWDRIDLAGCLPAHTRVEVATLTADTLLLHDELVQPHRWAPAGVWRDERGDEHAPPLCANADFMLRSGEGRYCWVRLRLFGTSAQTPCLDALSVDFPRITLRRYLPAIFGAEAIAAEFTDRWLAIFDRGLRNIETELDEQARLFDPLSAPAVPDVAPNRDFLAFLASWVGVTLQRAWPPARQRRILKLAPRLYPWRGTVAGLRGSLYLVLGLDRYVDCVPNSACCVPCPTREREKGKHGWRPPRLILEHFHLRRWMALGHARLSDAAKLWGERIVNRSRLESQTSIVHGGATDGAQVGVTQLKMTQDPARDPFHYYAHRLSIFVPAACARDPALARGLAQLVAEERPAHVATQMIFVEPRFRVGVQAMLGLDAVIGVRPQRLALDSTQLGKGTVLAGSPADGDAVSPPHHVGATRVGMSTILH